MRWIVKNMSRKDAMKISDWVYAPPYDIYNMNSVLDSINELMDGSGFAVYDSDECLSGFFCYGISARIMEGIQAGLYIRKDALDIGLGLRPDLCNQGYGESFLKEELDFAQKEFGAEVFRLTVAAFNLRAIQVYEKVGFQQTHAFTRVKEGKATDFLVMLKEDPDYKPWKAKFIDIIR